MINPGELRRNNRFGFFGFKYTAELPLLSWRILPNADIEEVELAFAYGFFDGKASIKKAIVPFANLLPVPLTAGLLVKYGFEYLPEMKSYIVYSRQPYLFSVCSTDKGFYLFGGEYPIGKEFLYVHQLQNLYFALTGEELRVNLIE